MIRRNIGNEAGARSDGVMIVSIIFIAAFTYIALTTDPVYTGIGVGDRAPDLNGQIYDGTVWVDFDLGEQFNDTWSEGEPGTYYLVEFMDTNCGICVSAAEQKLHHKNNSLVGDNPNAQCLKESLLNSWQFLSPSGMIVYPVRNTEGL